jgi:hypothetical protein
MPSFINKHIILSVIMLSVSYISFQIAPLHVVLTTAVMLNVVATWAQSYSTLLTGF